jgi:glutamate-1-semialdehyde aminotransferase/malonyl CoA-acyl carrier protein transacylase
MLSVRLAAGIVETRLPATLSIAAENSPGACVVSGPTPDIESFKVALEADGIGVRLLQTSHAFHSSMMDPAVSVFEREVRTVRLSPPKTPIISTRTGTPLTDREAIDPSYWAGHLRAPVRFSSAVQRALMTANTAFLEVGPRGTLSTLARQHGKSGQPPVVAVPSLADTPSVEHAHMLFAQGQLWTLGLELATPAANPAEGRRRALLPTYPFERHRYWLDAGAPAGAPVAVSKPAPAADTQPRSVQPAESFPLLPITMTPPVPHASRLPQLVTRLRALFEDIAGVDLSEADSSANFVELGLDSLTLTQAAMQVKKAFKAPVTFRQLMEQYRSFDTLASFLDASLPADAVPTPAPVASAPAPSSAPGLAAMPSPLPTMPLAAGATTSFVQQVIQQQMQLMAQQLAVLSGAPAMQAGVGVPANPQPAAPPAVPTAPEPTSTQTTRVEESGPVRYDVKKAFGAIARIHTHSSALTDRQRARLDAFIRRYTDRTAKSKAYTTEHRPHLADPRVVNGFRPIIKEIIYQIVIERSAGSRMWDIDGNEYVDVLSGFGMNLFGWQPDFVNDVVRAQLDAGYDIGPQHPLAGEVAKLVCELTGFDRAGLCNTGSEAVMAAIRIARTVTGRNMLVVFTGSYHGTFDEVVVRAGRAGKGIPGAPGIMSGAFSDVRVLDYGTPESLEFIRNNADDIGAVLVEPVQSRRPDFQPVEFLKEVRAITEKSGTCLIFDEVITGFRSHLGGAQAIFGIRADLSSYGKVIGGGFPIGVIAGTRAFMDVLDGGSWQYGDDSIPTVGVTYFAGTFVRHPLALAAARASLQHLKEQGEGLQTRLNQTTSAMADELTAFCRQVGAPIEIRYFASLWRVTWLEDHQLQDLLFAMMRSRGVHILDNFPCFMTTAHTPEDVALIKNAFKESVAELQEAEFLPRRADAAVVVDASQPPTPNARLGRDKDGNPAWFVPDANVPGKYYKYKSASVVTVN